MREILVLFLALALIPLLLTCEERQIDDDPGIDFVLADIVGTWNFPDQSGDSDITVEILNPSPMVVFIKWTHAENVYDCYGHGGLKVKWFLIYPLPSRIGMAVSRLSVREKVLLME